MNRPIRKSPNLLYHLYSRNPPHPTIEEELLKAFRASGAIDPDWFDRPQQAYFQRASRTDKGVSAIKMIISLRMGRLNVKMTLMHPYTRLSYYQCL